MICVKDNGVGFNTENINSEKLHGLEITKDVIKTTSLLYKSPIKLKIISEDNNGTTVTLSIPLMKS